jgi:hypothetical protein
VGIPITANRRLARLALGVLGMAKLATLYACPGKACCGFDGCFNGTGMQAVPPSGRRHFPFNINSYIELIFYYRGLQIEYGTITHSSSTDRANLPRACFIVAMPLCRFVPILISSLLLCGCIAQTPPPPSVHPNAVLEGIQRYEQVNARIANERLLIDVRVTRGDYTAAAGADLKRRLDDVQRDAARIASQHDGGLDADTQRALNERLTAISGAIAR